VTAPTNLVEKLAAVMAKVERVPKTGWNDFHKYKYATEADITDAVRAEMAAQGVMLFPSVEHIDWKDMPTKSGAVERLATMTVKFTATDGKDSVSFTVLGEGQDRSDKATYKAMTGATKYALLKLFLIPTGDDPEREESEKPQTGAKERPTRPVEPPKAAPVPPPAYVAALWKRAFTEFKDRAKGKWEAAALAVLADPNSESFPPSNTWTVEQAKKVEDVLFPSDIPF
jgi:hypothetical protein